MGERLRGFRGRNRNEVPRGVLSLHNETTRRNNRRIVWLGMVGAQRTGRSTLATRFNEMQRDVLENYEIVIGDSYRFTINLRTRPRLNRTGFVDVGLFIGPMPREPFGHDAMLEIYNIQALIFLFDVNRNRTLNKACHKIDEYRLHKGENMPPSILVGNKIDIRDGTTNNQTADGLHPDAVSTLYGESIARSFGIVEYFECSALRNIAVGPVLDRILQLILR